AETKNNGVKNGKVNQETKEITWTVDINYNQLSLTDAKLIDEIAANQSLIDESIKIFPTTVNEEGKIVVGDEVKNIPFTVRENENGNKQIEINFGQIKQSYRVEFKTKDKD